MSMSVRPGIPPPTGRTTLRSKRDKQERLKHFLIQKLRERNAIDDEDPHTLKVMNEEADRMLCKPASEQELRNAEVRILKRLQPATPSRALQTPSTNRSAVSQATTALDGYYQQSNKTPRSTRMSSRTSSTARTNKDPMMNQDYWLKFTKMDVDNYRVEERRRQEEDKRRKSANAKYLDEQVKLKTRTQKVAKLADKQWKSEVSKDSSNGRRRTWWLRQGSASVESSISKTLTPCWPTRRS